MGSLGLSGRLLGDLSEGRLEASGRLSGRLLGLGWPQAWLQKTLPRGFKGRCDFVPICAIENAPQQGRPIPQLDHGPCADPARTPTPGSCLGKYPRIRIRNSNNKRKRIISKINSETEEREGRVFSRKLEKKLDQTVVTAYKDGDVILHKYFDKETLTIF